MSGLLSASELAGMQSAVDSSLDRSVTISRVGLANDGVGGRTETWTADGSPTPCRIGSAKEQQQVLFTGAIRTTSYEFVGTFAIDTGNPPPKLRDRLHDNGDGFDYEVVAVATSPSHEVQAKVGLVRQ